jgi:hypothetical protein
MAALTACTASSPTELSDLRANFVSPMPTMATEAPAVMATNHIIRMDYGQAAVKAG